MGAAPGKTKKDKQTKMADSKTQSTTKSTSTATTKPASTQPTKAVKESAPAPAPKTEAEKKEEARIKLRQSIAASVPPSNVKSAVPLQATAEPTKTSIVYKPLDFASLPKPSLSALSFAYGEQTHLKVTILRAGFSVHALPQQGSGNYDDNPVFFNQIV